MTDQTRDAKSEETFTTRLTPESLFNLLVKAIGLYWLIYGVLTCVETCYAWFLGRIKDMTVFVDSQAYTTLWGVAMLAVGAWLIVYSKWTTRLAYSFDAMQDVPDDALEQSDPPQPPTEVN